MFNLSKTRRAAKEWKEPKDVDDKFTQENRYHSGLMQNIGREEAVQNLGNYYAVRAFISNDEDPLSVPLKDMMKEYFYYLKRYDHEFLKEVAALSREVIKKFLKDPNALEAATQTVAPQVPSPAPAGAAPPPAPLGPGPMARSNRRVKTAGHAIFLKKENGDHVLKKTLAGKILGGNYQIIDEDGVGKILSIDGDVAVPRTGPAARMVFKIEEELPNVIKGAAADFLADKGISEADVSRTVVQPYLRNGSFDLRPISVRIGGADLGYLLYKDIPGAEEPKEVSGLRKAIGKAMGDMVRNLVSALEIEGVKVDLKPISMPSYAGKEDGMPDRHPTRDPRVLDTKRLMTSLDVPSLVMTVASQRTSPEDRTVAIDRLIEVISSHPKAYEPERLSKRDIIAMSRMTNCSDPGDPVCQKMERLAKFVDLFAADDAEVMQAFSASNDKDKALIASMVAKQGRTNILQTNPSMAVLKTKNGYKINDAFISSLDPSDDKGLETIKTATQLVAEKKARPSRALSQKIVQALFQNGDHDLLEASLDTDMPARDFAILTLLERGGEDDKRRAVEGLSDPRGPGGFQRALMTVAVVRNFEDDPDVLKLASDKLKVSPKTVAIFLGKEPACSYMRASRMGWSGDILPQASDIHSLSDDPVPLMKNYYDRASIGDKDSIASLHKMYHLVADKIHQDGADPYTQYALKYLQDALAKLGEDVEVLERFVGSAKEPDKRPMTAQMLPDGTIMVKKGGVYYLPEVDQCFSSAPKYACTLAMERLAEARD